VAKRVVASSKMVSRYSLTQILCQDIQSAASDSGEKLKLNNTGALLYVFVDTRSPQAPSYAYTLVVTPGT
jgi:hypothetical protein